MNTNSQSTIMPKVDKSSYSYAELSDIVPSDKNLLQTAVRQMRPDSNNYEDSWGYIIQATRNGGFKWYDPQTASLIFFGRKSATNSTLVIPSFFADPEYLAYVIRQVENTYQIFHSIVKNVNSSDIGAFTPYGFRPYKKTECWFAEARFDDQTYPQMVIDLRKTIEAKGKFFQNLRTTLNKMPPIEIKKYRNTDYKKILELFHLKDKASTNRISDVKKMYFTSHAMYPQARVDKFIVIDKKTKKIIGFIATSDITSNNTALVASIFKPGVRIESVWGIYKTFELKYHEGFKLINLGGNETKGTFNFMREKFRPVEMLHKTHLIYDPQEL